MTCDQRWFVGMFRVHIGLRGSLPLFHSLGSHLDVAFEKVRYAASASTLYYLRLSLIESMHQIVRGEVSRYRLWTYCELDRFTVAELPLCIEIDIVRQPRSQPPKKTRSRKLSNQSSIPTLPRYWEIIKE